MKGSVYKRCSCAPTYGKRGERLACKVKHGSWFYAADAGVDPRTNKRRQIKRGGFATKAEAEGALAELVARASTGTIPHDDRQTVSAYLEVWLAGKVANGLRPTTERSYRQHIDDYLTPELGHLRLRDLRGSHVETMLAEVARPRESGTRVKPATVRRVHATLRSALATAKKKRLVQFNAAQDVELPFAPRPKARPWEPADLGAFLDAVAADRLGPYLELTAASGLRRGEALGLRWPDVDLAQGRLSVRQQIAQLPGMHECARCGRSHRGLIFAAPKTESGEDRIVDLDSTTIGLLLEHRLRQDTERAEWGPAYNDHGLVFAQDDGNPLPPNRVSMHFAALVKRSGLRRVRLHDLRHGRASLLLASGTDIAIVSKLLGHSSLAITSDTYSHLLAGVGREAAERAAALVPRASKSSAGNESTDSCDQSVTNTAVRGA